MHYTLLPFFFAIYLSIAFTVEHAKILWIQPIKLVTLVVNREGGNIVYIVYFLLSFFYFFLFGSILNELDAHLARHAIVKPPYRLVMITEGEEGHAIIRGQQKGKRFSLLFKQTPSETCTEDRSLWLCYLTKRYRRPGCDITYSTRYRRERERKREGEREREAAMDAVVHAQKVRT